MGITLYPLLKGSMFVDLDLKMNRFQSEGALISEDMKKPDVTVLDCEVAVVGGGAGGVAASMQSARMGVKTCLIEETDWLGGMLTSAGVSAIDGHPENFAGIFREFINEVKDYYKNKGQSFQTSLCHVSPLCFEPHVGSNIFRQMTSKTENLSVYYNSKIQKVYREGDLIKGVMFTNSLGGKFVIPARVTVDATEFGDLMYLADVPYDLGFEANSNEPHVTEAESCIQPITYVAILKNYGRDMTISKPENYDEKNYVCTVKGPDCPDSTTHFDMTRLLNYGKMPNNKLMINTPSHSFGNDFHATANELDSYSRDRILKMAKDYTLGYIYFIQTELGMNEYGLANEFNTDDYLAKIPYVRESRRLKGSYRMTEFDVTPDPNNKGRSKVFSSSIAVGDYPIDLHFCTTGIDDVFFNVMPYQIPYETTVPEKIDGFMVAEKNISVSHIVNGTTRLQPVVMAVSQAVGAAAALSVQEGVQPRDINISKLQEVILGYGGSIVYFKDVPEYHFAYPSISRAYSDNLALGYEDFSFKPDEIITREELSDITFKITDLDVNLFFIWNDYFKDQDVNVKRSELAGFLANYFAYPYGVTVDSGPDLPYKDVQKENPHYNEIRKLLMLNVLSANENFRPDDYATRAETIVLLERTMKYLHAAKGSTASVQE